MTTTAKRLRCDDPSGLDAVFLHLRVEQLAMDAQTTRRFGPVAIGLAQGATDHRLLQLCSGGGQLALHEVLSLVRFARFDEKGEIALPDRAAARDDAH